MSVLVAAGAPHAGSNACDQSCPAWLSILLLVIVCEVTPAGSLQRCCTSIDVVRVITAELKSVLREKLTDRLTDVARAAERHGGSSAADKVLELCINAIMCFATQWGGPVGGKRSVLRSRLKNACLPEFGADLIAALPRLCEQKSHLLRFLL